MPTRALPARPSLDHLKHEAKALLRAHQQGDAGAVARMRAALGEMPSPKLTDAQRAIAREYGFPTWARLRAHVQAARGIDDAVTAFLEAVQQEDAARAREIVQAQPRIASESLHVAATLGRTEDVTRLLAEDPGRVGARIGPFGGDPLLYLCHSPFHGESAERDTALLATARVLLAAGADPNTREAMFGTPALFAVTGRRSIIPIARLLLESGANPTDGESLHHAAERFHEDALELLLAAGADLNANDNAWGNTPLHFLLRWYDVARHERVRLGVTWLLAHGADPNVVCGTERETALHLSARLGQQPSVIRLLLEHGASVEARRADGRTPWSLAARGGFDEVVRELEGFGARPEPLSAVDGLLAACGRGDIDRSRALASAELIRSLEPADQTLLPFAASVGRDATVLACVAAGFPIDTTDDAGGTALHYAALRGRAELVRALLDAGARFDIVDKEHSSTALGWACWAADFNRAPDGDYPGTVRALVKAGARFVGEEHRPRDAGVLL